jgi:hypothetical protein
LKAESGTARAWVVAAELLDELLCSSECAVATLDPCLAEGTPCGAC